ncbi:TPA: hypothetical protein ACVGN0_005114 [Pseudomonas aeruginosa]|uniref:hypothetical protein n=1 Tax=Pseudomonas aeruginosa TaxID=287 RepID=UPI00053DB659|nr:hypothetical protein [Pseudomonas aeruginosa]MUJ04992.1 hypothetical protein [Pseudomonas aeruginosa]HBO5168329.1 hypothetical protein [Pseudomonas aeruginosa]HBP6223145.1 hypothetical protein [Pseudomonas aeruginosa]HBP6230352.1 hypothetical protein [Pseudomonas aeruginosa]HBP6518154.1 hypothetical protein [Pseudomonas aeruginosa]
MAKAKTEEAEAVQAPVQDHPTPELPVTFIDQAYRQRTLIIPGGVTVQVRNSEVVADTEEVFEWLVARAEFVRK